MEFAAVLVFKSRFFTSLVVLVESLRRPSYKLWQALGFEPFELVLYPSVVDGKVFFSQAINSSCESCFVCVLLEVAELARAL